MTRPPFEEFDLDLGNGVGCVTYAIAILLGACSWYVFIKGFVCLFTFLSR